MHLKGGCLRGERKHSGKAHEDCKNQKQERSNKNEKGDGTADGKEFFQITIE